MSRPKEEYDLEHHIRFKIGYSFCFSCQKKGHAYSCNQNFTFCPSCGMKLITKERKC